MYILFHKRLIKFESENALLVKLPYSHLLFWHSKRFYTPVDDKLFTLWFEDNWNIRATCKARFGQIKNVWRKNINDVIDEFNLKVVQDT